MRQYFYSNSIILSRWLTVNARARHAEDALFRTAFLAALAIDPASDLDELRERLLNMTMAEQHTYASNYHLEAAYKIFSSLSRHGRGTLMLRNHAHAISTQLVDPDFFPIWDLRDRGAILESMWKTKAGELRYEIGHQTVVRQSGVEHHEGGEGVYVVLPQHRKCIQPGELVCFVPGNLYKSREAYEIITEKSLSYMRVSQHLDMPRGKILQMDYVKRKGRLLNPVWINPYATGHKVNHPPPGKQPNVVLSEMTFPSEYLPSYLMQYLPYEDFTPGKQVTMIGLFAIKPIKDRQQIFVDYTESHIFPIERVPEWLIHPPRKSKIFDYTEKKEYEVPEAGYWTILDRLALWDKRHEYEKYLKQTSYRAEKFEYEDDQVTLHSFGSDSSH